MIVPLKSAADISAEIHTRLARCTRALGAETDLGVKTYQGRRRIDDTMIPCSVVIEGDDVVADDSKFGQVELHQRYIIFAYIPCDPDDPNVAAHAAIRDMKRAIFSLNGKPDPKWAGRVLEVSYLGRDIGPRADGAAFVLAAIEIQVCYVETLHNP